MAILKTANQTGKYFDNAAKTTVIAYILQPRKMVNNYYGGVNVDLSHPAESMARVSAAFGKNTGIQLRHFIIAFTPDEADDPAMVNEIAYHIACYIGQNYQVVYAVHEDHTNLHIHLVFNSVSFLDGHRYYGTRAEFYAFYNHLRALLRRYGISHLEYRSNRSRRAQ